MTRYCVIGAGAAGVSALHQLRAAGYEVDCFEKTNRVGGHWHTDYDALHMITSRDMTAFEDFPMPADYPHFPGATRSGAISSPTHRPAVCTTSSSSTPRCTRWCPWTPTARSGRPGGW